MKSEKHSLQNTAIEAKQLSFSYPDGTTALREVSLRIAYGEKVAVIGPNGSGKSTLLTLLNGIRRGTGLLKIAGMEPVRRHLAEIRKNVGLVFQNPDDQLFCPTIFEDVAFGPLNLGMPAAEVREHVRQALAQVGLTGYEKRSSFHLSYGERKLASLATVLAMNPPLIVMDEPTSNLDPAHRRKIIRWIQGSRRTFIITSHDLDMVLETCSRVILLNRGKIVAEGEVSAILQNEPLLSENSLELPLMLQQAKPPVNFFQ
ncbi:MAG: ABC transporter ATP-binding protein [Calditrichia bacterium]